MSSPEVSIVICNYNHPELIVRLVESLAATADVTYEVIVVDNGSDKATRDILNHLTTANKINTLILEPINHYFSEGNNIGVRRSNPISKYILLLNSDTKILHPKWLLRMIQWMEGIPDTRACDSHPIIPTPGPRDIVSIGWSSDPLVPGHARAEGWCCLIRKTQWRDMSPDFPFHGGFEEMVADRMRNGANVGVLCNYNKYIVHYEQGSGGSSATPAGKRPVDINEWFRDAGPAETLDFTRDPVSARCYGYLGW